MCSYSLESAEVKFEKAADPAARWFVRLRTPDDGAVVLEVRAREHVDGTKHFFRAEVRPVWRERTEWPSFEKGQFHPLQNAVQVTVDTAEGAAKFGPNGNIIMNPRGCGLGSYLMSRVIRWLKENYPEVRVLRGQLSGNDARNEEDAKRRNRFYEKHNFDFDWHEEGLSGSFFKARAGNLKECSTDIEEFTVDNLARNYCDAIGKIRELSQDLASTRRSRSELEAVITRRNRSLLVISVVLVLFIAFPALPQILRNVTVAMATH